MATESEEVEESESLCSSCTKLREEIESTKKEHALTIKIIKQKIISTDELIRKYQKKCQDFDKLTKQLEELSKNYEDSQSNAATLQMQLEKSMRAAETLQKNVSILDRDRRLGDSNVKALQERLEKSEGMCANLQAIVSKKEEDECTWRLEQQIQAQEIQKKDEIIKKNEDSLLKVQSQLSKEKESKKEQGKELSAIKRKMTKLEKQLCQLKDERSSFSKRKSIQKEQTPEPAVAPVDWLSTLTKDVCTTPQKNKAIKGGRFLTSHKKAAFKSLIPDDMLFFLHPPVSPLPRSPMNPTHPNSMAEGDGQGGSLSDSSFEDGENNYSSDSSLGSLCDLLGYGNGGGDETNNTLDRGSEDNKLSNEVEHSLERHTTGNNRMESAENQNEVVPIMTQTVSSKSSQKGLESKSKDSTVFASEDVSKPSENEFDIRKKNSITSENQVTCSSGGTEITSTEELKFELEASSASAQEKREESSGKMPILESDNTMLGKQNSLTSFAGEKKEKTLGKTQDSDNSFVDMNVKSSIKDKVSKVFPGDTYEQSDSSTSDQVPRKNYVDKKDKAHVENCWDKQNKVPRENCGDKQNKTPKEDCTDKQNKVPKENYEDKQNKIPKEDCTDKQNKVPKENYEDKQNKIPKEDCTDKQNKMPKENYEDKQNKIPKEDCSDKQNKVPKENYEDKQNKIPKEDCTDKQNMVPKEGRGETQIKSPKENCWDKKKKDQGVSLRTTTQFAHTGELQTSNDPVDVISNQKEHTAKKDEIKITVSTPENELPDKCVIPKLVLTEMETTFNQETKNDVKLLETNEINSELKAMRKYSTENSQTPKSLYAIVRDHVNLKSEKEESKKVNNDNVATKLETSTTNKSLENVCPSPSSKVKESRKRKCSGDTVDTPARITRSKSRLLSSYRNSEELLSSDDSDKGTSNTSAKTKMPRLEKEVFSGKVNSGTLAEAVSKNRFSEETKEKVILELGRSQVEVKTNNLIPMAETCYDQSGVGKLTISQLNQSNSQITQENKNSLGKLKSQCSHSKSHSNNNKEVNLLKIPDVLISFSEEVQESAVDNLYVTKTESDDPKKESYSPEKITILSPPSSLSMLLPSTSSMDDSPVSTKCSLRPSIVRDLELIEDFGPPVSPLPPSPPCFNVESSVPSPYLKENDSIPDKDGTSSVLEPTDLEQESSNKISEKIRDPKISARTNENKRESQFKGLSVRPAYLKEVSYACKCLKRIGAGDVEQKVVADRFRDKKCLSSSAPLVTAVVRFLKRNATDLSSEIVSQCRSWKEKDKFEINGTTKQFVEEWKPVMTQFEFDLLEVLMITSTADQHRGLIGDIICQLTSSIAEACAVCADDWTGVESQCRFLTALCHRQKEAKRVKIVVYDILRLLHRVPARVVRLALCIAAVWPAVFILDHAATHDSGGDDHSNKGVDLANSSLSPLLCILSAVLKKWAADASLGEEMNLLELLWPSNYQLFETDLGKLACELVKVLQCGPLTTLRVTSDGFSFLESGAFEAVKALELIACALGWEWSHNVLIGQLLWGILQSWACANEGQESKVVKQEADVKNKEDGLEENIEPGIREACVVAVVQLIGLLCKTAVEHSETSALDIVTLLCGILKQASSHPLVTHNVQVAAAFSLLQVSPWQLAQVSSCLQQWIKSTSVPVPPRLVQAIELIRKMEPSS